MDESVFEMTLGKDGFEVYRIREVVIDGESDDDENADLKCAQW